MENFNSTPASLKNMSNVTDMENDTMENFNSTPASLKNMSYVTDMENDTMLINITDYSWRNIILSLHHIEKVFNIVTLCIELPVICWAVFALYHQVKADNVTPVYVINLLISDFIQIIGRLVFLMYNDREHYDTGLALFFFGVETSILFMVCIALERYLLVVHPLWYRCRRTIKHSIFTSLAVYASDVLFFTAGICDWYIVFFSYSLIYIVCTSFLLLPLPLLVFFLGATWRALSHSVSVPHTEKKRILGTLALVLLIYLVLFFPAIFALLSVLDQSGERAILYCKMKYVAFMFVEISPLLDTLLYILIKKYARYTLKVPQCCRRLCTHKVIRKTSTDPTEDVTSV